MREARRWRRIERANRSRAGAMATVNTQLESVAARIAGTSTVRICIQAVATVRDGNRVVDRYVTPFGIRTIEFDQREGIPAERAHVKLQGVCDHHDLGALGTAVNRRATERQIQIMKAMGVERAPHQPQPAVARDARIRDRLGWW